MILLKYILGILLAIPIIPILIAQGKWVKRTVPKLPEPEDVTGITGTSGKRINLLAIGESTVSGVGVSSHHLGITGHVAKNLAAQLGAQVHWHVAAKSGFNAKRVRTEIIPLIAIEHADIIMVGQGGNDAFELNTPWGWNREVRYLIEAIQAKYPTVPIVFINMPPVKEFPAFPWPFNQFLGGLVYIISEQLKVVVKDYEHVYYMSKNLFSKQWASDNVGAYTRNDFFSDGVHPSELTYELWGKEVAEFVVAEQILP